MRQPGFWRVRWNRVGFELSNQESHKTKRASPHCELALKTAAQSVVQWRMLPVNRDKLRRTGDLLPVDRGTLTSISKNEEIKKREKAQKDLREKDSEV